MDAIVWVATKIKDKRRRPFGPPLRDTTLKRRAVLKNGEYNILPPKFPGRYYYYVQDIFTGLVDAEWKWTLQVLGIGFTGGWLIFSLIWWLIAFVHKDLHDDHLPARQAETGWSPCVLNIHGFASCFLYSLETQHTTGYGLRAITEECPEAIFILCCQCISGMIIDGFTVGVVVAKMMRPRLANYTIQFSKNAVVGLRDGEICMMFRAGDIRKAPLVGASIRAILIHNKKTKEEKLNFYQTDLEVEVDSAGSDLFLIWPITIVHKINEDSPFYQLSAADMLRHKFEIILILEGTVESTGQGTNAQTSYLSNEILWAHRFETMVSFNADTQSYEVNYDHFEKTLQIDMPFCSAAEFEAEGSQKDDDEKQSDIQSDNQIQEPDIESLELPYTPSPRKSEARSTAVTSECHSRRFSFPQSPLNQKSYVSQRIRTPRSIAAYYPPRRHIIEMNGSIPRSTLVKQNLSSYEYINYSPYDNVPEDASRSETPPFPVDWV